jgi:pSer/pThr/pTyr-binding forkhead associated (FHA) protein
MIACPNCLYNNMTGAFFCAECGSPLIQDESEKTGKIRFTDMDNSGSGSGSVKRPSTIPGTPYPQAIISLHLLNSNVVLPLPDEDEVILGRATEGQSMVPDINLEPYRAFDAGVSRIHAAIRVSDNQALITDLGSGNGTRINGSKIEPNTPHSIKNGDILNLGKLQIQVIMQDKAS